ncbi:MAG: Arm DNA-binding domain-containing protein [Candidatus Malihini olakiniferum]
MKLSNSHGLYLHVKSTGSRFWYFRYYFGGKEN